MWQRRRRLLNDYLVTLSKLPCHPFSSNSKCNVGELVIAAAARTPVGRIGGQLATFKAPQLAAAVLELLVKQTAMPREHLDAVIVGCGNVAGIGQAPARQAAMTAGLSKNVCSTTIVDDGLKAVFAGAQMLQLGLASAVIAGSMESASNVPFYLPRGPTSYGGVNLDDGLVVDTIALKSLTFRCPSLDAALEEEIAPLRLQQKRKVPTLVSLDEIDQSSHNNTAYDSASAILLINAENATRLNIKPLARVLAYEQASSMAELLKRSSLCLPNITLWEAQPPVRELLQCQGIELQSSISIPALINNGVHMVTHLVHALTPGQLGCAIVAGASTETEAMAILVEKLDAPNLGLNGKIPLFTLYTKDPCPLCDMLLEDLAAQFPNREEYDLKKIFITDKKNIRYLRAFRFDIPVLFLNGQYLCMHKLNVDLLKRRLKSIN